MRNVMRNEITFKELLDIDWVKDDEIGRHEDLGARADDDGAVLFISTLVWGDYYPVSHRMQSEENEKFFRMLMHSKDMFKLLSELDDDRAKDLINKING